MPAVEVQIVGLERLQRKLDGAMEPVRDMIKETVEFAEEKTREGAKPHPVDKGTLARGNNIRKSIAPGAVPLHAKVFSRSPIVITVDEGRRPTGKIAPITALTRWAVRHGIDKRRGFFIARSIGRRGSKGVRFFKRAATATEKEAPKIANKTVTRIEKNWGR